MKAQLQSGLIGHWTCNNVDSGSTLLYDRSGYGNHMSAVNSPTTGHDAPVGQAVGFDVSDGDHYVNDFIPEYDISGPFSIFMWLYLGSDPNVDSNNNYREVFSPAASHNPYGINIEQGRNLTYNVYVNGGSRQFISSPNQMPVGSWVHVGFWFDPSTGESAQFYNGSRSGLGTYTSGSIDGNSSGLYITDSGGSSGGGTFPGRLSDIRLYDRKVSDSEVNAMYQMRNGRWAYV